MMCRVLIVEDEIFVAMEIEHIVEQMGLHAVGIAADMASALALADQADLALVDMNLRDGRTGCLIAAQLAEQFGIRVVFLTANPDLITIVPTGAIGVISKPVAEDDLAAAISYAAAWRDHTSTYPPAGLQLFVPPTAPPSA